MVELQAAHFSNQLAASIAQSEELATLSIKTALQFVRGAYPGHAQTKASSPRRTLKTAASGCYARPVLSNLGQAT